MTNNIETTRLVIIHQKLVNKYVIEFEHRNIYRHAVNTPGVCFNIFGQPLITYNWSYYNKPGKWYAGDGIKSFKTYYEAKLWLEKNKHQLLK